MSRFASICKLSAIWIAASWLRTLPEIVYSSERWFQRWIFKLGRAIAVHPPETQDWSNVSNTFLQFVKKLCIPVARRNNQRRLSKIRIN